MPLMRCPRCEVRIPTGPLNASCKNCGWTSADGFADLAALTKKQTIMPPPDDFTPDSWLTAALSVGGAKDAFKIIGGHIQMDNHGSAYTIRVLHKDTGAVWRFVCTVEREPTK